MGAERPAERIPPTVARVEVIAEAIDDRFRLHVLVGASSGLRWGELLALARASVDLLPGSITVSPPSPCVSERQASLSVEAFVRA
jgi:integrase